MKKVRKNDKDELRSEYDLSDFPGGFVRGKYVDRLRKSSNIVVLRLEVAEAFPNQEAVNNALLSLIDVARKTTRLKKRSTERAKKNAGRLASAFSAQEEAIRAAAPDPPAYEPLCSRQIPLPPFFKRGEGS